MVNKASDKAWDKSLNVLFTNKHFKSASKMFNWHLKLVDEIVNPAAEERRYRQEIVKLLLGLIKAIMHEFKLRLAQQVSTLICDLHQRLHASKLDRFYQDVCGHKNNSWIEQHLLEYIS